ncbi:MAG: SOS response-associated peptidase family protein, partial [Bacillota bacterium]|nr:SOS response-associated peptidase family protein [Bacillota bacterium]
EKILEYYDFIEEYQKNRRTAKEVFPSENTIAIEKNKLTEMQWGMKYEFSKKLIINARIETVMEKKLFKKAIIARRIILPASGYYEWEKREKLSIKRKIELNSKSIMSLAGIYNIIRIGDEWVRAFVVLTKPADPSIRAIHSRMPVIIPKDMEKKWLYGEASDTIINELIDISNYDFKIL